MQFHAVVLLIFIPPLPRGRSRVASSPSPRAGQKSGSAAVEGNDLSSEESRLIAGEEDREVAHIVGPPLPPNRVKAHQRLTRRRGIGIGIQILLAKIGVDPTGCDCVAAN